MEHSFNIYLAKHIGINASVIYKNIWHWCEKNRANGKHFYDGKYWTYNSVKAFSDLFPYLTEKQIRTAIDKLLEVGLIESGSYNKLNYDRTKWYTVTGKCILQEGKLDLPSGANGFAQQGEPIPDIKTDVNTDSKLSFCEQGSRMEYSSDFDSQDKVADKKNEYTKNNNIDLFDKKSMASKSGKDKGMYNFTKNMFMAIYEEEFKEKYIWKASDAGSVYPIISGIYEKMVEKNPEKEMTIGDVCLGIETFIRISVKMRDGYFLKSFSVPNLYSKFNDIFLKINETRNGKQSDHLSKRGVTHFKFNVPDPRGTNGQDAGI